VALALAVGVGVGVAARGEEEGPIRARLIVAPGPYVAGQAIRVRVVAVAGGDRPEIAWPEGPDVEVTPAGTSTRPIATSGIGSVVDRTIQYIYEFWVVPRRAGAFSLPAVTLRLGERSGTTRPIRLEVRPVPAAGRSSAFLGGVGSLEVAAEAAPTRLKVGQWLEFRIVLGGPAALGSFRTPNLGRVERLGIRVEPLPDARAGRPPGRTFRWRLRPARAGTMTLPPIAIASFDPTSGRYMTRTTSSIPIEVIDVHAFDPSRLLDAADGRSAGRRWWPLAVLVAIMAVGGAGALGFWAWRTRTRRPVKPQEVARRLAERFEATRDDPASVAAVKITEALIEYLRAAADRPPGALTPAETRHALESVGDELAERVARLVAGCDRARFADPAEPSDAGALRVEAGAVFRKLAGR
jgi:hypothetical protein